MFPSSPSNIILSGLLTDLSRSPAYLLPRCSSDYDVRNETLGHGDYSRRTQYMDEWRGNPKEIPVRSDDTHP